MIKYGKLYLLVLKYVSNCWDRHAKRKPEIKRLKGTEKVDGKNQNHSTK